MIKKCCSPIVIESTASVNSSSYTMSDIMGILIARIFSVKRQFLAYTSIIVLPEVYSAFQTYRFLQIDAHPSVTKEFGDKYPFHYALIQKLKKNYDLGFHYLAPAAFAGQAFYQWGRMHMMRLNTGHSVLFRLSKVVFYSALLASTMAIAPLIHTYIFHASPSLCKQTTLG
jgi:hypothetical protein